MKEKIGFVIFIAGLMVISVIDEVRKKIKRKWENL
jgi:hypothetical protein